MRTESLLEPLSASALSSFFNLKGCSFGNLGNKLKKCNVSECYFGIITSTTYYTLKKGCVSLKNILNQILRTSSSKKYLSDSQTVIQATVLFKVSAVMACFMINQFNYICS